MTNNLFTEERCRRNVLGGHNIRIIGHTGVGKTSRCLHILNEMGLETVMLPAPNTDPYLRMGGLPHVTVVDQNRFLDFVRSPDIEKMQVLYIDEFARGTREFHQQAFEILNAVAGRKRTLMGIPVPNLMSVVTTDNPADSDDTIRYDVATLEHAIETRFHAHLWMEGSPDIDWLSDTFLMFETEWSESCFTPPNALPHRFVARCLVKWWEENLDDAGRLAISPRVLEYIGRQVVLGDDPAIAIPFGVEVPVHMLRDRLAEHQIITMDLMKSDPDLVVKMLEDDPSATTVLNDLLREATKEDWAEVRGFLQYLPMDRRYGLVSDKNIFRRMADSFGELTDTGNIESLYRWMEEASNE
jgi:hypothetical protein